MINLAVVRKRMACPKSEILTERTMAMVGSGEQKWEKRTSKNLFNSKVHIIERNPY